MAAVANENGKGEAGGWFRTPCANGDDMANNSNLDVPAGHVIFSEGDKGDVMYVLLDGAVELRKRFGGGETVLKTIEGANDFFGEMALIDGKLRSASAVAVKASRLMTVDAQTFENMILKNGAFALQIIRGLSTRLRNSNEQLGDILDTPPVERTWNGIAGLASRVEPAADGRRMLPLNKVRGWLNTRMGLDIRDIDRALLEAARAGLLAFGGPEDQPKSVLYVSDGFIQKYDRRK